MSEWTHYSNFWEKTFYPKNKQEGNYTRIELEMVKMPKDLWNPYTSGYDYIIKVKIHERRPYMKSWGGYNEHNLKFDSESKQHLALQKLLKNNFYEKPYYMYKKDD